MIYSGIRPRGNRRLNQDPLSRSSHRKRHPQDLSTERVIAAAETIINFNNIRMCQTIFVIWQKCYCNVKDIGENRRELGIS